MGKSTLRFGLLIFCAFTLFSCTKDPINEELTSVDNVVKKAAIYSYTNIELDIIAEVNAYRESLGLNALQPIGDISLTAEDHSEYMATQGQVSHDNFGQRYSDLVNAIGAKAVSENVAYGYHSAEAVVKAWINSEAHKKNIIDNHTHMGISVIADDEGKNYFTHIFVKK